MLMEWNWKCESNRIVLKPNVRSVVRESFFKLSKLTQTVIVDDLNNSGTEQRIESKKKRKRKKLTCKLNFSRLPSTSFYLWH